MTHSILYNEGAQTLYHLPRDRMGRPRRVASATYSIVDLSYGEDDAQRTVQASTAATIGAQNETLTAAAGPSTANPRRVQINDSSVFTVGRRYVLVASEGHQEAIRVASVDTATNRVEATHDLRQSFSTGDSLRAIELEATFPASVANDDERTVDDLSQNFQIVWDYSIDGRAWLVPEMIEVKRYTAQTWATVEDMIMRHPALARRSRGPDAVVLSDALVAGQEDVEVELEAAGLDVDYYRTRKTGKVLVAIAGIEHVLRSYYGDDDRAEADRYREQYKAIIHNLLTHEAPLGSKVIRPSTDQVAEGEQDANQTWIIG